MRSTTPMHSTRSLRAAYRMVAGAALAALMSGCMLFAKPPADLDYSRTRISEAGLYQGTILP
jgi:hypothetical protein